MDKGDVAVIGAGSWGTAIAGLLSKKSISTRLWGHRREHRERLRKERENKKYLPKLIFNEHIHVAEDIETAVKGAGTICMAVPSQYYRTVYKEILSHIDRDVTVVSVAKGIENDSLSTMCQVMEQEKESTAGNWLVTPAVLTGPSFAREVADNMPTAVTIGCKEREKAEILQEIFSTEYFRVYTSIDVIGLEISGAFKNIIAIATGICDGLGYGLNTRAALITRGLAEIARLGKKMGADPLTFSGLSGVGDLILTCTGDLSRNRSVGIGLGSGKTLERIMEEMSMVAEGIKTTRSGYQLAQKMKVEMPILEQVYRILYEEKDVETAVSDLLARESKPEQLLI